MENLSIYSNRCWYNGKLVPATIVITGASIKDVLPYKTNDAIDAGNSIVMPGVIDAHVHVNEPGRTEWEGFETATRAAAKGGTSTIIDMPLNADPVTTTISAFREKLTSAKDKLFVNCGFYGGLVPGNSDELQLLIEAGVLGIKCFLTHSGIDSFPNVLPDDLNKAMPLIAKYGSTLLVHCELIENSAGGEYQDHGSYQSYLESRPDETEVRAVELMIELCRQHRCRVHIVHVSSAESLVHIQHAKNEGLPLTAETCAHYIYFNAASIPDKKPVYKCAPPIRDLRNNYALKLALKTGILDFLTSDHSPAPPEIKNIDSGDVMKAWGGIAGLQFLLSAGWTACRETMSLEEYIPLVTSKPSAFLGLDKRKGIIEKDFDADLVIWDPEGDSTVSAGEIEHRHKISPYIGENLFGVVEKTIVGGRIVYEKDKNICGLPTGKILINNREKY